MIIDTHAHIYAHAFDNDLALVLEKAKAEDVTRILMPAIDSETHERMLSLAKQHPNCLSMMGVHPCSIKENWEQELSIAEQYLAEQKFIAVGEIGLDYYWDLSFKEQQIAAFHRQIEWALHYDLPIVIHSRESTKDCIDIVREHQQGKLRGVFHCFSGTAEEAQQIVDLGFYLGIGGVLTFKNGGVDKAIEHIDTKYLVLETDAPYLAPVPYRGKRNEPSYTRLVAQRLADLKQVAVSEIEKATTANARHLFNLSE